MKYIQDYWFYFLLSILLTILSASILVSGEQNFFYMKQENTNVPGITYYCVYADISWRIDQTIFCSEDFPRVAMLNAALNIQKLPVIQLPTPTPKIKT